jgi:hypothetical protein
MRRSLSVSRNSERSPPMPRTASRPTRVHVVGDEVGPHASEIAVERAAGEGCSQHNDEREREAARR